MWCARICGSRGGRAIASRPRSSSSIRRAFPTSALFCVDLRTDLTLAALSFHVDRHRSVPLIITDLTVREDEYNALGLFAMAMLLDVLQDVAVACPNRADDEIGFIAANDTRTDAAKALGLRPCDTPKQLDKPGLYLCYRRRRSKRLETEGG